MRLVQIWLQEAVRVGVISYKEEAQSLDHKLIGDKVWELASKNLKHNFLDGLRGSKSKKHVEETIIILAVKLKEAFVILAQNDWATFSLLMLQAQHLWNN